MCGIAGVFRFKHGSSIEHAQALACLKHRGPDASGEYEDEQALLLHTRLSIIDLDGGNQPIYSKDNSLVLVANGEIYNHVELRKELEAVGHIFSTHSDCETILHAYQQYGKDFISKLRGMFAFALYDKNRKTVILGRDRLGIKPLYYCKTGSGLYFGSEIKAVLALSGIQRAVNENSLAEFFQVNFIHGDKTAFKDVYKLLPGHQLEITNDSTRHRRYWSITDTRSETKSFTQAADEFTDLMGEVIPMHLRSDVPIGIFLSGGLDSSVLTALFTQYYPDKTSSYSAGFDSNTVHNELDAAQRMAEQFGTAHHVIHADKKNLLDQLVANTWATDDLMGDYASLPTALLSRQASRNLKVVFSGEGGDEIFAGYSRYRAGPWNRWLALFSSDYIDRYKIKTMLKHSGTGFMSQHLNQSLTRWVDVMREHWGSYPDSWTPLQKRQAFDIQTWLPDDLLVKADRIMMRFGLEGRVPLLDHRVVEFGFKLPDQLKTDSRTGKLFLKRWAESVLPADHIWTRKKGFTVPVNDWLDKPLLETLYQTIKTDPELNYYFNATELKSLFEGQLKHRRNTALIWAILQFVIWHRLFIQDFYTEMPREVNPLDFLTSGN